MWMLELQIPCGTVKKRSQHTSKKETIATLAAYSKRCRVTGGGLVLVFENGEEISYEQLKTSKVRRKRPHEFGSVKLDWKAPTLD